MSDPQNRAKELMDIKLNIIVAAEENRGIGLNGNLPWEIPSETAHYYRMLKTASEGKRNAVIVGRVTYQPLRDPQFNNVLKIVITRGTSSDIPPENNLRTATSFADALKVLRQEMVGGEIEHVWVLGGRKIFEDALASPYLNRIYYTHIKGNFHCDTFFPDFDKTKFKTVRDKEIDGEEQTDNGIIYQIQIYERI